MIVAILVLPVSRLQVKSVAIRFLCNFWTPMAQLSARSVLLQSYRPEVALCCSHSLEMGMPCLRRVAVVGRPKPQPILAAFVSQ